MNIQDLRKPDFGEGPQEYVVSRVVLKALENGFDPRGDSWELMQVIKDDLAKLKEERGFSFTKSHVSWMLHRMVRHATKDGETASYIVLDRGGNIYDHVRETYKTRYGMKSPPHVSCLIQDEDYYLNEVDADSDDADWVVYELPDAEWDEGDIEIIKLRGECLYGVKRGEPIPPPLSEEEQLERYAESIRWQKG